MFITNEGPTENRTRITGIKIPCTNHYTMRPYFYYLIYLYISLERLTTNL